MAGDPVSRLLGLALLDRHRAPEGLLIPRCRSVHTYGMRFPLDLLFLGPDCQPLIAVREVGPGHRVRVPEAAAVLELPSDWDLEKWEEEGKWTFVDASPEPGERLVVAGEYDLGALMARVGHAIERVITPGHSTGESRTSSGVRMLRKTDSGLRDA